MKSIKPPQIQALIYGGTVRENLKQYRFWGYLFRRVKAQFSTLFHRVESKLYHPILNQYERMNYIVDNLHFSNQRNTINNDRAHRPLSIVFPHCHKTLFYTLIRIKHLALRPLRIPFPIARYDSQRTVFRYTQKACGKKQLPSDSFFHSSMIILFKFLTF